MAPVKIGINGFGRIGRLVTRAILDRHLGGQNDIQLVCVNEPFMDVEEIVYSLKHDSVHGKLQESITCKDGILTVGKHMHIQITHERNPECIEWKKAGVFAVIECTGVFLTVEKASGHIVGGAKKVIISAPSPDAPTFVYGVNHDKYDKKMNVVSNASCTTNCLAPIVHALNRHSLIEKGIMSTIHSATSTQKTVDGMSGKNRRLGRSIMSNIIPSTTGAAKAVGKVIPELNGKLTGMAFRVPTPNVSVVDFVCTLTRRATLEEIMSILKEASNTYLKGILGITNEHVVSTDFIGDSRSSIIDETLCVLLEGNLFKVVSWYDNEYGYSQRLVDLAYHLASKE